MLCAIKVYGVPNRHWQSETGSMGVNRQRAGILSRREVGWLFCFSTSGNQEDRPRQTTPQGLRLAGRFSAVECV